MTWAATAVVGGNIVGGYISSQGAQNAANTQAGAAEQAQQISKNEFNLIRKQEAPFLQGGYSSLGRLEELLGIGGVGKGTAAYGSLNKPFTIADWKRLSPAYRFQQQQGMQGVLNGDEASIGSLSGAAQKDLIGYNQNLANTSFNNAFNMYQTQQGNIYNRLSGLMNLGQNAAANRGNQGTQLAGQQAQSATNIGTALGAGQGGAANAWAGAAGNLAYLPYLFQGQGGGGAAGTAGGNMGSAVGG